MRTFTIPAESAAASLVFWYELSGGEVVAEFYERWRTKKDQIIAPRTLYRISADGTIRNRNELAIESGMLIWSNQSEAALLSYALPVPLILPMVESCFAWFINQSESYAAAVRAVLERSWRPLAAVTALGLLLAVAAWRRARAFGLPGREQAAWAVFVFLFGIPGYVGYRLHRRWPLRAECPNCHARAPRDREACARCEAVFPVEPLRGIEVFA